MGVASSIPDDLVFTSRMISRFTVAGASTSAGAITVDYKLPFKDAKNRLVEEFERVYWTRLLRKTSGNVSEAARQGGIHRKSLEYLLKKIDVGLEDESAD